MDRQKEAVDVRRNKFPVAEYTAAGALISLFSIFLGFYASAITFAAQSYPELNVSVINEIHRRIISNLILTSAVATPLIAGLFYLLARRYQALTGGKGE
ncbi:MAG: hypothetical protein A2049_07335 [Elusimicrobia bacterium GWA2_62_23]|nr:MAG: hypothetical protein A2049_07335 [Elusimicrobia bacterium GWA2_62_23]OGR73061.1 MAG: hypothetical protein A2179_01120 [Elusimicrobia bacterium GWC2_63_65]